MFKNRKKLYIALGAIVFVAIWVYAFRIDINVVHYAIESNKINNHTRIAFIADLHSCDYGEQQCKLLEKLYQEEPDLVLLGGDIVDDNLPEENAKEFLSSISKQYPCFYVSGNHEYWSGDIVRIKKIIKDYGISILEGAGVPYENGQTIMISGVDDPEVGEPEFQRQLQECANHLDKNQFSILLSHRPERIHDYLQYDFDLVLSGHAHGGQWRIPGILNGLLAPNQGYFPDYAGGLYEFDETSMIVSRGLAKESTRIPRIFNRPELVMVDLLPSKD